MSADAELTPLEDRDVPILAELYMKVEFEVPFRDFWEL